VRCWGIGGTLGNGLSTGSSVPTPVDLVIGATAVVAGRYHSCAIVDAGAVWCWGNNDLGQLGDGTATNALTPVRVVGLSGAVALSAGRNHTCALLDNGKLRCWGNNAEGQLGTGTLGGTSLTPAPVTGL
jgi:alpha-tubulin suppressor-like RCC1 family protein